MKRLSALAAAVAMALAWGCVITTKHTIDAHITVDIRHIEKQADNILDFVEGKTDALPAANGAKEKNAEKPKATSMLRRAAQWVSPMDVAYAAELKQSSPAITEIAKKLKERHPQLEALKAGGCVGEDNRGQVELRPCDALTDANKKNEAQQLLAAENADRKALYKEVATLNQDQNVTVNTVEHVYAQKRLERAKPGETFQLPDAGSDFDAFKKSDPGKKLAPSVRRARGSLSNNHIYPLLGGFRGYFMSAFGVEVPPSLICLYSHPLSKREALDQLVEAVLRFGVVSDELEFRTAVHEREAIMSTGIGVGIAIPHVRIPQVLKPTIAVGVSRPGIDFGALDDAPVNIVILFAMPSGAHREYLGLLAQVITSLKMPEFKDSLLACQSPEEAAAILNAQP